MKVYLKISRSCSSLMNDRGNFKTSFSVTLSSIATYVNSFLLSCSVLLIKISFCVMFLLSVMVLLTRSTKYNKINSTCTCSMLKIFLNKVVELDLFFLYFFCIVEENEIMPKCY